MKVLLKAVSGDPSVIGDPVSSDCGRVSPTLESSYEGKAHRMHSARFSLQMIDFLHKLLVDFDFDGAQSKLLQCADIVEADFFLAGLISRDEFVAAARTLLFETYCRVNQSIDLKLLAGQLHMTVDEAERWVVDLIRSAQLDARVDSRTGIVQMMQQAVSIYSQVSERTRDLTSRTRIMVDNTEAIAHGGDRDQQQRRS
jgi:translation initiation factor 3 subunit E